MSGRALVTGAAQGIGAAIAERLRARRGDLDVNLSGAFRVIQACLPGMRERRRGRIVAISSGAARDGLPGQAAYAASKAGLIGIVKTIAAENVRRGITANAVLPRDGRDREGARDARRDPRAPRRDPPAGRMASPAEIAGLVSFLASGYVTGESIAIDGGVSLNTKSLARVAIIPARRERAGR